WRGNQPHRITWWIATKYAKTALQNTPVKTKNQIFGDKEIADNLHINVSAVRNYINKRFEELDIT
ncbi:hypothetical protein, partial [Peribacillus frigoritolerans]|uniref:hypothetical protein n=1 Tax=Peribacillus frigoritolerans TaxID=450367 RepID=UPI0032E3CBF2